MNLWKSKCAWLFAAMLVAFCLAPSVALGQATSGTISGTVLDQSRASVPGAAITARNLDTNVSRAATTGVDGRYRFPGLPVGRYEVTVDAKGFAKYVRGPITPVLNQEAVVNLELQTATVQQTIVVTEDAMVLNTTTAEVGVQFDQRRLAELPISGQF